MYLKTLLALSALWVGFEIVLVVRRRAGGEAVRKDAGTLGLLNGVIYGSIGAGICLGASGVGRLDLPGPVRWAGLALIALGLGIRIWAVATLRRFFTVDVAIQADHRLVTSGPYRLVRHPAYSGALVSFAGLALASSSWVAALVMLLPIAATFAIRIRVEEAALRSAFPEEYERYSSRTTRLLPGIL